MYIHMYDPGEAIHTSSILAVEQRASTTELGL